MLRFALPGMAVVAVMVAVLAGAMNNWPAQQEIAAPAAPGQDDSARPSAEIARASAQIPDSFPLPAQQARPVPAQAEPYQQEAAPAPGLTVQMAPPVPPAPSRPAERKPKPPLAAEAKHAPPKGQETEARASFASVESLLRRLRARPSGGQPGIAAQAAFRSAPTPTPMSPPAPAVSAEERLTQARALLVSSNLDGARQALEEAAAQLVLRPVQPGQADMPAGPNPAAQAVNGALGWLEAGQPARALSMVNSALAELPRQYGANE